MIATVRPLFAGLATEHSAAHCNAKAHHAAQQVHFGTVSCAHMHWRDAVSLTTRQRCYLDSLIKRRLLI